MNHLPSAVTLCEVGLRDGLQNEKTLLSAGQKVELLRGVKRAVDCGCKKVKLNVSASRQHNLKNLNMTPEQSVAGFADCVQAANDNGIAISGSISTTPGAWLWPTSRRPWRRG